MAARADGGKERFSTGRLAPGGEHDFALKVRTEYAASFRLRKESLEEIASERIGQRTAFGDCLLGNVARKRDVHDCECDGQCASWRCEQGIEGREVTFLN